ncbi:MAG TPA: Hpt domain-containing protein [Lacipirellulaceae bacterium]|nr:Hpt domain-containing protein [Lacipirellulaceae bacterium]
MVLMDVPVLDFESVLARLDGDKQLFAEISGMLLEDAPRLLADLRTAVVEHDSKSVRAHAHALKGLLTNCGGMRAARIAQSLEDAGNSQQLDGAAAMLESLDEEMAVLSKVLRNYGA